MKTLKFTGCIVILFAFIGNTYAFKKEKIEDIKIDYIKKDVSCFGRTDGQIEIEICGGRPPYIIAWDNGSSNLEMTNLRSGEYSVKICDSRGKTATQYIYIESPSQLKLSLNNENRTVVDAVSGFMNAKIVGGTPWDFEDTDYYYTKINGQDNYENPELLADGEYEISIEDSKGCILKKNIQIDFSLSSSRNKESVTKKYPNKESILITVIDSPFFHWTEDTNNQNTASTN